MNRKRDSKQSSRIDRARRSGATQSNPEFRHCSRPASPLLPGSRAGSLAGGPAVTCSLASPRRSGWMQVGFSLFHGPA
jgi:hypothetical protein